MTHLSLFSGIGGLDLAAEMAGFKTVGQCEWADYPTKVLEKHWPDVPRWRDIRTLTGDSFYERTGLRTVDIISGGFPCQPFSVAGKRRGQEDDRYLWPEMCRVIKELRPRWVIGENVAGIVNMALDQVLSDLEAIGYTVRPFIIPACAVDAPHRRDRCAIVAHANSVGRIYREPEINAAEGWKPSQSELIGCSEDMAYANSKRLQEARPEQQATGPSGGGETIPDTESERRHGGESCTGQTGGDGYSDLCIYVPGEWWPAEPDVGRVAHGVPARVDRLKCLGNAVVPQQFYPVFAAIAEIEGREA